MSLHTGQFSPRGEQVIKKMENKVPQSLDVSETDGALGSPLVSIITPVLNGVKYLEACIQSVLEQTYPHIEHIFVDGASTDGTLDILSSYQAKYPDRIRFISEQDKGAGEAWNTGLRMAKGTIFGWLGSDDMSEPGAIQTVVDFFRANPNAYFVFGGCNVINEKGEVIGRTGLTDFNLKEMINSANPIPCPSAFYRREVIEKVGWVDTLGSDRDYWIKVGKVFTIYRLEKVLSRFRRHEGSASTGSSNEARKMWAREDYFTTRRYGGGIFSRYCRGYYQFVIIEALRPVFGFAYPFIKKVLRM